MNDIRTMSPEEHSKYKDGQKLPYICSKCTNIAVASHLDRYILCEKHRREHNEQIKDLMRSLGHSVI